MSFCRICYFICEKGKGNGRFCSLECRFISKVKKTDYCWEWTGAKISKRYGGIQFGKQNKLAHRTSWEIHFGKIPTNFHVLHHCDNGLCVNPEHLFLGTHQDNMDDKSRKGRVNNNPNRIIPIKEHKKIVKMFQDGFFQCEIAKKYNTYRAIIYNILKKYDVYKKRNKIIQPEDRWKILSLFNEGFKIKEIGKIFGCSDMNIKKILQNLRYQNPEKRFPNG